MRTICLGDTHGRTIWESIVKKEEWDRLVFIGDYFDSFDAPLLEQLANFQNICQFKRDSERVVIMLIGNHDHHYFPEIGNTGTSGYQGPAKAANICFLLTENRELMQMAYQFDNILCTHAGVSEQFMGNIFGKDGWKIGTICEQLNELWKHKPRSFIFCGRNSHGDDTEQTPIWIRPTSLMKASQNIKKELIQVVGHTGQPSIDIKGKSTGGRYFFIDTLGVGEYLIVEDGKFIKGKI